jgi:hypothetical protein
VATPAATLTAPSRTWSKARPLRAAVAALLGPDLGGQAACAGQAPTFDEQLDRETAEAAEARHHRPATVGSAWQDVGPCMPRWTMPPQPAAMQ